MKTQKRARRAKTGGDGKDAAVLAEAYLRHNPDETPLAMALQSRNVHLAHLLIRHKAILNVRPGRPASADSPLAVCARTGQKELASTLVSLGAVANLNDSKRLIEEDLLSQEWIRWVLGSWVTPAAATKLLWVAAAASHKSPGGPAVVLRLLDLNANVNDKGYFSGDAPASLPLVAVATCPRIIKLLAAAGANISSFDLGTAWDARGHWKRSPPSLPMGFTHATLDALVQAGLDLGKRPIWNRTLLGMALRAGDADVCRALLRARPELLFDVPPGSDVGDGMRYDVCYPSNHLARSCYNLCVSHVKILLACGVDPESRSNPKERRVGTLDHSPLHLAREHCYFQADCNYESVEIICLLLDHGAALAHMAHWTDQATCTYEPCSKGGRQECALRSSVYSRLAAELGASISRVLFKDAVKLLLDYVLPSVRHDDCS